MNEDGTKLVIIYTDGTKKEISLDSNECTEHENVTVHEFKDFEHSAVYNAAEGKWEFEEGKYLLVCNDCDHSEIVIDVIHNFMEVTVAPTCTEIGFDGKYCLDCDYYEAIAGTEKAALDHSFTVKNDVVEYDRNICTEGNWQLGTCDRGCGAMSPVYVPAPGHTVEKWVERIAPTATQRGTLVGTCTVCNATCENEIPAFNTTDYTYAIETDSGVLGDKEIWTYTLGEQIFSYMVPLFAKGHNLVYGLVEEDGVFKFTIKCSDCTAMDSTVDVTDLVMLDKAGSKAALCNKAGCNRYVFEYTAGKTVSCNVAVPAIGEHMLVVDGKIIEPDANGYYSSAYVGKGITVLVDADEKYPDVVTPGNTYNGFFTCVCGMNQSVTIINQAIDPTCHQNLTAILTVVPTTACGGVLKITCSCGDFYNYELPALLDTDFYAEFEVDEDDPDCYNHGTMKYTGKVSVPANGFFAAKELDVEFTVITAATEHSAQPSADKLIVYTVEETIAGAKWDVTYTVYQCEICGKYLVVDTYVHAAAIAPITPVSSEED